MKQFIHKYIEFDKKKFIVGIILAILTLVIIMLNDYSLNTGFIYSLLFIVLSPLKLKKENKILNTILYIIYILLFTYYIITNTQYMLFETVINIKPFYFLLIFMIIFFLYFITYTLTGSKNISLGFPLFTFLILSTINHYVCLFRGTELTPMDIISVGTAINVAGQYEFIINDYIVNIWISSLLFFFIGFMFPKLIKIKSIFKRGFSLVFSIVLFVLFMIGSQDVIVCYWGSDGTYVNGYILNFVMQIKNSIVLPPNSNSMNTILSDLEDTYSQDVNSEYNKKPHVIVIMNEAFADLEIVNDLNTNKEVLPYYKSLKKNTIKGYALSSIFGGNTSTSEFEFLTGASFGFLPSGTVPYLQYMNEERTSLVSTMKKNGYTCIATHPYLASGWSRPKVYNNLGFDEMTFIEDYPQENLLRDYVSDQEMYEYVIKKYEEVSKNEKLFLFGVTMQNHGGYTYEGDNYTQSIELEGYPLAEQYLSVLHESDKALKYLINYFSKVKEDVVIVFYGDHMPSIETDLFECDEPTRFKIPFFVWANYDIEEQENVETSINYLSNYIFDITSIEEDPYHRFLDDMDEIIPSMNSYWYYSNEKGQYVEYKEASGIEKEWLDKYNILQYNYLFSRNKSEVFFGE